MAQMPVVEEGAEPPPYFPRTLVMLRVGMQPVTLRVTFSRERSTCSHRDNPQIPLNQLYP